MKKDKPDLIDFADTFLNVQIQRYQREFFDALENRNKIVFVSARRSGRGLIEKMITEATITVICENLKKSRPTETDGHFYYQWENYVDQMGKELARSTSDFDMENFKERCGILKESP